MTNARSRIAISGPISDLQAIRRETRAQDWPACAETAQSELIDWMDETIKAFIDFAGNEPDSTVEEYVENADSHRVAFRRALRDLRE